MTIVLGAKQARQQFAELLGRVGYGGEIAIIERSGKPMAAIIPIEIYKKYLDERRERFEVIDRIQRRMPDIPPDEVENDVREAIRETREGYASGSS